MPVSVADCSKSHEPCQKPSFSYHILQSGDEPGFDCHDMNGHFPSRDGLCRRTPRRVGKIDVPNISLLSSICLFFPLTYSAFSSAENLACQSPARCPRNRKTFWKSCETTWIPLHSQGLASHLCSFPFATFGLLTSMSGQTKTHLLVPNPCFPLLPRLCSEC